MSWYNSIIDSLSGIEISDESKNIVSALLYAFLGFLSSIAIEWYKKRKTPKEESADVTHKLTSSAKENIETAQDLISILDDRLEKERVYFEDKIQRSKIDCEDQIIRLKESYDKALFEVQKKNEAEKKELSDKITQLEFDKVDLQKQVDALTKRLKKYENGVKNE